MNIHDIKAKQVGVTDEVTVCDCCGKTDLKRTVVFQNLSEIGSDNELFFLGSECAKKQKYYPVTKFKKNKITRDLYQDFTVSVGSRFHEYRYNITKFEFEWKSPIEQAYKWIDRTSIQAKLKAGERITGATNEVAIALNLDF